MTTKIEIAGQQYAVEKLPALAQFHVTRRLAPILATMGISIQALSQGSKMAIDDFLPIMGPVSEVIAHMSDEEVNYIIFTCLAVVSRQSGDKFARITAPNTETLMFQDIDMGTMLRLTVEVVKDSLGNFMQGLNDNLPSASS